MASFAFVESHKPPWLGSDVLRSRLNQSVVELLLDDVRRPACDASDDKQRREKIAVQTEIVIQPSRWPIDIGSQFFVLPHCRFDGINRVLQPLPFGSLRQVLADDLE